eukprot:12899043-Heterocapsa_arctica.AAC.5
MRFSPSSTTAIVFSSFLAADDAICRKQRAKDWEQKRPGAIRNTKVKGQTASASMNGCFATEPVHFIRLGKPEAS